MSGEIAASSNDELANRLVSTERLAGCGQENEEPHHPTDAVPPVPGGAAFR